MKPNSSPPPTFAFSPILRGAILGLTSIITVGLLAACSDSPAPKPVASKAAKPDKAPKGAKPASSTDKSSDEAAPASRAGAARPAPPVPRSPLPSAATSVPASGPEFTNSVVSADSDSSGYTPTYSTSPGTTGGNANAASGGGSPGVTSGSGAGTGSLPTTPAATPNKADTKPPSATDAIKDVFGVASRTESAPTSPGQLSSVWHTRKVTLGDSTLQVVFLQTQDMDPATQKPLLEPGTAPLLSAAVYQLVGDRWALVSASKHFASFGDNGAVKKTDKSEVLEFPQGPAFLFDDIQTVDSSVKSSKAVFVFQGAAIGWAELGRVRTGASSLPAIGPSAPGYFKYTGTVAMVPGAASTFPQLKVTRTGTNLVLGQSTPATDSLLVYEAGGYSESP